MQIALTVTAIESRDNKVVGAAVPALVAALGPGASSADTRGAILEALASIGMPAAEAVLDALEKARGVGKEKAGHRLALFEALERLGPKGWSEENEDRTKAWTYSDKEVYPDVRDAARRALRAIREGKPKSGARPGG
jgi:hypothetical protein